MLVYGMGEQPLREILKLARQGVPFSSMRNINQVAFVHDARTDLRDYNGWNTVELASHEECLRDKIKYAANFKIVEVESNKWQANRITQRVGDQVLVINPGLFWWMQFLHHFGPPRQVHRIAERKVGPQRGGRNHEASRV